MKKLIACVFNMVSDCVELKFSDSSMIAINCTAMENKKVWYTEHRVENDIRGNSTEVNDLWKLRL